MVDWQKLRELIDACRPGSQDLHAPHMLDAAQQVAADESARSLYDATQRQDALLAQAFGDVEVPDGLAERLLAALGRTPPQPAASSPLAEIANADPQAPEIADTFAAAPSRRRLLGRWLAAVAIAGSLVFAVWTVWRREAPLDDARLAALARDWIERVESSQEKLGWQSFDAAQFPQLAWRPQRWAELPTSLDGHAKVFDFPYRSGRRLLIFQITADVQTALPPVPFHGLPNTGPWQLGAWQENGILYVAVTNHGPLLEALRTRYPAT
jgi:hypothetical protein